MNLRPGFTHELKPHHILLERLDHVRGSHGRLLRKAAMLRLLVAAAPTIGVARELEHGVGGELFDERLRNDPELHERLRVEDFAPQLEEVEAPRER